MSSYSNIVSGFRTPEARWARFGPYYAMFPIDFAFDVVNNYSKRGDCIIDPFAGRSSSIYAGGALGRHSLGIEINPVGWLYGKVKLRPADENEVLARLFDVYSKRNYYSRSIHGIHDFYRMCFCDDVLKFLLAARKHLNWRSNNVDSTLMSIILVYLHGKIGEGLSNQMRMTKSMGINYSIEWWKKNELFEPPELNPAEFLRKRINWRYRKGLPKITKSQVVFGDSSIELKKMVERSKKCDVRFSLLFTSPPYYSVTDYHADQWLRLWMLGGPDIPHSINDKHKGRFVSKIDYKNLLDSVFSNCSSLMARKSTIYVRTDYRKFTFETTLDILEKNFPSHSLEIIERPFAKKTQTLIHGNRSSSKGEFDIIMRS